MNKYEQDNLNGYGYNTRVQYQPNPMNQETFNYNNNKGADLINVKGYLSNIRPTFDPRNMNQATKDHSFMYDDLLNLLQYSPGSSEYNIKGDALLVKFLTGSVWFGGQIIDHQFLTLCDEALNENDAKCFNPDISKGSNCPLSGSLIWTVMGKIAAGAGITLAFYSPKNNASSKDIDYDYWPVDATGNSKIHNQKLADNSNLYYSTNLSYFKGPNILPQVKGLGRLLYRAVIDKSPASIASIFEARDPNSFLGFNLIPFNPDTDRKYTYVRSSTDKSILYGIDQNDKTFQLKNNKKNLQPLLNKATKQADGSYNVIINNNFANKNNLKTGDSFNYNVSVPTEQYNETPKDKNGWKNIQNLNGYSMDSYDPQIQSPDVFYSPDGTGNWNKSTTFGSQIGEFRNQEITHKMNCHIIGVSSDSMTPSIFMQQSALNKFISDKINIQWSSSNSADSSWQNYYNGTFNQIDPSPLMKSLVGYNPNGSYNLLGLSGTKVNGVEYKGIQLIIFDNMWSKSLFQTSFSQFETLINAVLIIISSILVLFSILFLLISLNIILKENKKNILLYKTLGYSNTKISVKFILIYYLTSILAFIISIPIMGLLLQVVLGFMSSGLSIYIIFAMPWFVPVIVAVILLTILVAGFFTTIRYINRLSLTKAANW